MRVFRLFIPLFLFFSIEISAAASPEQIATWPAFHRAIAEHREEDALKILQKDPQQAHQDILTVDKVVLENGYNGEYGVTVHPFREILGWVGYHQHQYLPYRTTVSLAAEYGCNVVLKRLLEMGVSPSRAFVEIEQQGGYFFTEEWIISIYSPLASAIYTGNLEATQLLLDYDSPTTVITRKDQFFAGLCNCDSYIPWINMRSSYQRSAAQTIQLAGLDPTLEDNFYRILIKHAGKGRSKHKEIPQEVVDLFKRLQEQMVLSTVGDKTLPISHVLRTAFEQECSEENLALLLEYGIDPLLILVDTLRYHDPKYFNIVRNYLPKEIPGLLEEPLISAAVSSHIQGTTWLIETCDLKALQDSENSKIALFRSAFASGYTEIPEYLFSVGLKPNITFALAVESGHTDMVNLVVKLNQVTYEEVTQFINTEFRKDKASARMITLVLSIQKQLQPIYK